MLQSSEGMRRSQSNTFVVSNLPRAPTTVPESSHRLGPGKCSLLLLAGSIKRKLSRWGSIDKLRGSANSALDYCRRFLLFVCLYHSRSRLFCSTGAMDEESHPLSVLPPDPARNGALYSTIGVKNPGGGDSPDSKSGSTRYDEAGNASSQRTVRHQTWEGGGKNDLYNGR